MNPKDDLQKEIDALSSLAWQMNGEEQRSIMHKLIVLYNQLLQLEVDPYFVYESKARIHQHLRENTKAEACLLKLIEISPKSTLAWSLLAEVQFDAGQFAEALKSLDTCISHDFTPDFRYEFRSQINTALGNNEEAKKDKKIYDDYQAREKAKWDDPNHYYHYK